MRTSTTIGIIISILVFFGIATFVFSKIEINPTFVNTMTGDELLGASGLKSASLLDFITDGIRESIGSTISNIFSW